MTYFERLKACKLPTLHYRHIRGDMIKMFKILSGKYDTAVTPLHGLIESIILLNLHAKFDVSSSNRSRDMEGVRKFQK